MARPIWRSSNNNLSSLSENEFFRFQLEATNAVNYRVISGTVPPGMQVSNTGSFQGIPNVSAISGQEQVFQYQFVVRATGSDGAIADRAFTVSVTNIKVPQIIGPSSDLGTFREGDFVDIRIQTIDSTDPENLIYRIVSGVLPNNNIDNDYKIQLSSSGRLFGYILALPDVSRVYTFTIEVTDGLNSSRKTFSLTAQQAGGSRRPILLTAPSELLPTKHDNFYNFQFLGYDFDGETLQFNIVNRSGNILSSERGFDTAGFDDFGYDATISSIADSLTLDPDTGWLYGQLPIVDRFVDYEFDVEVLKSVPPFTTGFIKRFVLRVNQFDVFDIAWDSPENLGSIFNGEISTLSVQAVSPTDSNLNYRILPYNPFDPRPVRLPQGLVLTDQGLLIGRPSFRSFILDQGNTTVSDQGTTSFDETFRFTVEARNSFDNQTVTERSNRTFTVRVQHRNPVPYETVHLQALLSTEKRTRYRNLIKSTDWLPEEVVYRSSDPSFGRQLNLRSLFLPGVEIPLVEKYINAIELNHYKKRIKLGTLGLAVARDDQFNDLYEVIYANIIDDQEQNQDSIALEIDLLGQLLNYYKIGGVDQTKIYPNSLKNMKTRLLEFLTLERRGVLPRWMTTVQDDGSVLGLINAVPLVYVKPGTGAVVQQRLEAKIRNELDIFSEFNFDVDRYQVDQHLSRYWNFDTNNFISSRETTFDRFTTNRQQLNVVATVDYAVTVPFDSIDGANLFQLLGYSDIEIVSEQTYPVNSPSWSSWMNQRAVWSNPGSSYFYGETFVINRDFVVTAAGDYSIYLMNSDVVKVTIDGLTVFNNVSANVTNDPNNVSSLIYLARGQHNIVITMTVESNPNPNIQIWNLRPRGVAVEISNESVTVFDTRLNYEPKITFRTRRLTPGIDGEINIATGQTLVFAQQSDFAEYQGENHGWNKISEYYGVVYDSQDFNQYQVIPGLGSIQNQRAGIWRIELDQNNTVLLNFHQEVSPFQLVIVTRGATYADTTLYLRAQPELGRSELSYELIPKILSNATIFDGGDTRFLDYRDLYLDPGRGDKYVLYPKLGVFE